MKQSIACTGAPNSGSIANDKYDPCRGRIGLTLAAVCLVLLGTVACGSGGGGSTVSRGSSEQVATPSIKTTAAQSGAEIVTLTDTTGGATIYYTLDGTTPTATSPQYFAPMLIASNVTLNAIGTLTGDTSSAVATQTFSPNLPSGTLVWSDEFSNSTGANAQPDATVWTYDTGNGGFGNQELENYCAWGSSTSPCDPTNPNVYVGTDGYLHIVARSPSSGVYTSARMKSEGLFGSTMAASRRASCCRRDRACGRRFGCSAITSTLHRGPPAASRTSWSTSTRPRLTGSPAPSMAPT